MFAQYSSAFVGILKRFSQFQEHLAKQRQRLEDAYCLLKQDHERRARDFRSLQVRLEMKRTCAYHFDLNSYFFQGKR